MRRRRRAECSRVPMRSPWRNLAGSGTRRASGSAFENWPPHSGPLGRPRPSLQPRRPLLGSASFLLLCGDPMLVLAGISFVTGFAFLGVAAWLGLRRLRENFDERPTVIYQPPST